MTLVQILLLVAPLKEFQQPVNISDAVMKKARWFFSDHFVTQLGLLMLLAMLLRIMFKSLHAPSANISSAAENGTSFTN